MKKRKLLLILTLIFSLLMFVTGCAAGDNYLPNDGDGSIQENEVLAPLEATNRKIIYSVNLNVKTTNLKETITHVKSLLQITEWISDERVGEDYNYMLLRIKTSRLDDFIETIRGEYETTRFEKSSQDVTGNYQSIQNRIAVLQAEYDRLLELYGTASMTQMIEINSRMSVVEGELLTLTGSLDNIDSDVDYSKVYLYIYGPAASPNAPKFGDEVNSAFINGWNATLSVLKFFVKALVSLVPFLVIIVPLVGVGVGIHFVVKNQRKKRPPKLRKPAHRPGARLPKEELKVIEKEEPIKPIEEDEKN